MLALLLNSCVDLVPVVSPPVGNLPEQAVLYLRADTFSLLDIEGEAPGTAELFRIRDVIAVRVDARPGTRFGLGATAGGSPRVTRFGPYLVHSVPEPPAVPPDFTFINRSWLTEAVFLGFDADFPAYRIEIKALDGPAAGKVETLVLLKGETFLGVNPCLGKTYDWAATEVELRAAGFSLTGKLTTPGPWIHVRAPLGTQASSFAHVMDWLTERWRDLVGLAFATTALAVLLWRRRRRIKN